MQFCSVSQRFYGGDPQVFASGTAVFVEFFLCEPSQNVTRI